MSVLRFQFFEFFGFVASTKKLGIGPALYLCCFLLFEGAHKVFRDSFDAFDERVRLFLFKLGDIDYFF